MFGKQDLPDFDSFNNNNTNSNKKVITGTNSNDKFDPFGLSVSEARTSKSSTPTNSFGFEANFANFDAFNNNNTTLSDNSFNDDAWGVAKPTIKTKKIKDSDVKANKLTKFSSDYSDNYEKDLEQVLKRSMIDQ